MCLSRGKVFETQDISCIFLTGGYVTDPTRAAIMRLYDINKGVWNAEMLEFLGITAKRLPEVQRSGTFIGYLTAEAAAAFGLNTDVKVYNGAHDQYCASIGSGVISPGRLLPATGTAWVLFGVTEKPLFSKSHISPGVHPWGGFGAMASLSGIGAVVEGFASSYGESLGSLDKKAEQFQEMTENFLIFRVLVEGLPAASGYCI